LRSMRRYATYVEALQPLTKKELVWKTRGYAVIVDGRVVQVISEAYKGRFWKWAYEKREAILNETPRITPILFILFPEYPQRIREGLYRLPSEVIVWVGGQTVLNAFAGWGEEVRPTRRGWARVGRPGADDGIVTKQHTLCSLLLSKLRFQALVPPAIP